MKITLPEHLGEITLAKYLEKEKIEERTDINNKEKEKRVFSLFTGIKYKDLKNISEKDYNDVVNIINKAITLKPEFKQRFELNGVEYGFIPNFDDTTKNEFDDMTLYQDDKEDLNKLMAVLFREVETKDSFGNYTIKKYTGTKERAEIFKQIPMHIVDGAVFFFSSLSNELKIYIQKYTAKVQAKAKKR